MKSKQQRLELYEKLCKEKLNIEKMEPAGVDRFDFYSVHIGNLTEVLEQVYEQGFMDGSRFLP